MKTIIIITMALIAGDALAVSKCLIDGKVSYQKSPCPSYAKNEKFGGAVSSIGSERVRNQIEEKRYREEMARIEAERQEEKQQELAIKTHQIEQNQMLQEKIDNLQKGIKRAESAARTANATSANAARTAHETNRLIQNEITHDRMWGR